MSLTRIYELMKEYTHKYTGMMNAGIHGNEIKECREMMLSLQQKLLNDRKSQNRQPIFPS